MSNYPSHRVVSCPSPWAQRPCDTENSITTHYNYTRNADPTPTPTGSRYSHHSANSSAGVNQIVLMPNTRTFTTMPAAESRANRRRHSVTVSTIMTGNSGRMHLVNAPLVSSPVCVPMASMTTSAIYDGQLLPQTRVYDDCGSVTHFVLRPAPAPVPVPVQLSTNTANLRVQSSKLVHCTSTTSSFTLQPAGGGVEESVIPQGGSHVNEILIPIGRAAPTVVHSVPNELPSASNVNVVKLSPGQRVAVRLGRSGILVHRNNDTVSQQPQRVYSVSSASSSSSPLSPCSSVSDISSASNIIVLRGPQNTPKAKKRVNFAPIPSDSESGSNCNFTCHSRCMRNVDFTCPGNPQLVSSQSSSVIKQTPAAHHSQAHIHVTDAHAVPGDGTTAADNLQTHQEWDRDRDRNRDSSRTDSPMTTSSGYASVSSLRSASQPSSSASESHDSGKPKLLATVFDVPYSEDSLKSPLGVIDLANSSERRGSCSGSGSGSSDLGAPSDCGSARPRSHRHSERSDATATNEDDTETEGDGDGDGDASRSPLLTPSGANTADEDSANGGSPPPNAVGNVPAYEFTSLDKWSMQRFRIRVNEVQPHSHSATAKERPRSGAEFDWESSSTEDYERRETRDDCTADLLSDVTVNEYTDVYRCSYSGADCNCGTAVRPLAKGQSIVDGNNLSLPIRLTRCGYSDVIDDRVRSSGCESDTMRTHRTEAESFHTAKTSQFTDGLAPSCAADGDPELDWYVALHQRSDDAQQEVPLDRCLSVFAHNSFGFSARRVADASDVDGIGVANLVGSIRVYINLIRPIKMALSARPLTIYDLLPTANGTPEAPGKDEQLETFLLPRGTTRLLHISSITTSSQLICCLLRKFNIRDNPRKFALYEHTIETEHDVTIRKLTDHERPLLTCFRWAVDVAFDHDAFLALLAKKRLVLQENESGDIDWEAFSTPELNNFLLILQREEEDRLREIRHKYRLIKREFQRIQKEGAERQPTTGEGEAQRRVE